MGGTSSPNIGALESNPLPQISAAQPGGALPTTNTAQFIPNLPAQNPGQFAMGGPPSGMMGGAPPFAPNQQVLSQAGVAATPYGFGSPNPYAGFFGGGGNAGGGNGNLNANLMSALMSMTPTSPNLPQAATPQPINVPGINYSGG